MANISIRKLDDRTVARLRVQAARRGISMEEEVRRILNRAVSAPERIGDLATTCFGVERGVDLELPARESYDPVNLTE